MVRRRVAAALSFVLAWLGSAQAGEVTVAVAANFAAPMREIAAAFAQDTPHEAVLVTGATRLFYAQIKQGAPFDVLVAADGQTPAQLIEEGWAVERQTYAVGRLVLWQRQQVAPEQLREQFARGAFESLAIADPKLAPYGVAAMQVISALGLAPANAFRVVMGHSVGQAYQFVATGHARLGLVAASQVMRDGQVLTGTVWPIPAHLYAPIRQDAALLRRAQHRPAARALMRYLQSASARAVIRSYGYGLE